MGDELIWLERVPGRQEVVGSNPIFSTEIYIKNRYDLAVFLLFNCQVSQRY